MELSTKGRQMLSLEVQPLTIVAMPLSTRMPFIW